MKELIRPYLYYNGKPLRKYWKTTLSSEPPHFSSVQGDNSPKKEQRKQNFDSKTTTKSRRIGATSRRQAKDKQKTLILRVLKAIFSMGCKKSTKNDIHNNYITYNYKKE